MHRHKARKSWIVHYIHSNSSQLADIRGLISLLLSFNPSQNPLCLWIEGARTWFTACNFSRTYCGFFPNVQFSTDSNNQTIMSHARVHARHIDLPRVRVEACLRAWSWMLASPVVHTCALRSASGPYLQASATTNNHLRTGGADRIGGGAETISQKDELEEKL